MEVSVIIVNWNSAELLRKCLLSVLTNLANCDLEVLVLDNASYDGSAEMVNKEFPSVTFLQAEQNMGFAGGNNRAFQQSTGRNVLFLNPDTELVGGALHTMLVALKSRKDAGVVGPKLVNPDLSAQIDCMRAFPTILNQFFDSSLTRKVFAKFDFAGVKPVIKGDNNPVSVEMLPGTCVMLRRELFEQAGLFNEKYFMYAEDIELSYRVKNAGWTNYYVSNATVIHHGGCSSQQKTESFFSTVMMNEAVWQFLCATRGQWYGAVHRTATGLAAILRLTVLCFLRLLPVRRQRRSRAARSYNKWIMVLRWSVGLEGWARAYKPTPTQEPRTTLVA
jgi:GT2 family glycosyltransferase